MFKLIVGCYEQMLLGYSVTKTKDSDSGELDADLIFTDHSHTGCIKTVACGSTFLASGATDETIYLFDLMKNNEVGSIQGHEGTINHLDFPDQKYLISTSDDGIINIWHASSTWKKAKSLRGHKGPVTSFAVHPSGKIAMSASSKDGSLRTWNLISGRPIYIKNMKKFGPDFVKFCPGEGRYYAIASSKAVHIYELESAKLIKEIDWESVGKILSIEFVTENLLAVTGEGDHIHIYHTQDGELLSKFEAHTARVKALKALPCSKSLLMDEKSALLASASSDGHVKVWQIDEDRLMNREETVLKAPTCVLDIDTKARVTCLAFWQEP